MAERSDQFRTSAAGDDRETLLEIARQITGAGIERAKGDARASCKEDEADAAARAAGPPSGSAGPSFTDSGSGMAICAGGRILRANRSFALAFGYPSPEALTAAGGLAAIFPADRRAMDTATVNGGTRRLLTATTRSRRRIEMPVALHAVTGDDGMPAILIVLHPGAGDQHCDARKDKTQDETRVEAQDETQGENQAETLDETPDETLDDTLDDALAGPSRAAVAGVRECVERGRATTTEAAFLARVSHDIRTPLNSIIGFAQLMKAEQAGPLGNERYRGYVGDILESGEYALRLIDDLLIISRIEAGAFALNFASVDLNALIAERVAAMHGNAQKRRVFLRVSLDDALPLVLADRPTLERIVLNLLDNAIAGSHPGGQVIVECRKTASGAVQIRVQDGGSGMSGEEIRHALQPLVQRDTAPRPQFGNGLALALTKALAEANRAEFRLESEPGRGTRIAIAFPPRRTAPRPA